MYILFIKNKKIKLFFYFFLGACYANACKSSQVFRSTVDLLPARDSTDVALPTWRREELYHPQTNQARYLQTPDLENTHGKHLHLQFCTKRVTLLSAIWT